MLVYAATLRFAKEARFEDAARAMAEWLRKKLRREVNFRALLVPGDRMIDAGHQIEVEESDGEPHLTSIRYTHRDQEVNGRSWVTEVGLLREKAGGELECSVLLRTDEISARVGDGAPVEPSRPGIVVELLRRCKPSLRTPGLFVDELVVDSGEAFRDHVTDPGRSHPIVIVSSDPSGQYPIDPEKLRGLVSGIAEVFAVPPGADTYRIERIVGRVFCAWGGAIRLIYPASGDRVPSRLLLAEDIKAIVAAGRRPEQEVLSLLLHRMNLPNSRRHITRDEVRQFRVRRELSSSRDAAMATNDAEELKRYIKELEGTFSSNEAEKDELKGDLLTAGIEIDAKDDRIEELDGEVRRLNFEVKNLKDALAARGRARPDGTTDSADLTDAIADAIVDDPTPEDCLVILSHLYADRLEILDSAWRSAEDSVTFKHGRQLYELLHALVNEYFEALSAGEPDSTARKVFGSNYAARESDTVQGTSDAMRRRVFDYNGTPVEMMKHLKIGRKDSVAETIRVHFEWFADEGRIIIGYCGRHIPFH